MDKGFTIELIKEVDADEVLEHMKRFYFKVSKFNIKIFKPTYLNILFDGNRMHL